MTDEQLREWAYRTGDGDVGAAVIRLLLEKRQLQEQVAFTKCIQERHYFPGGQWNCECGKHNRAMMGDTEVTEMPGMTFDGTYPMRNTTVDCTSKGSGL